MRKVYITLIAMLCLAIAAAGYVSKRGIPFSYEVKRWSIGIYTGESPFSLSSPASDINPVLTAGQVTDVSAEFVADPFMVKEDSTWYMFFEVLNKTTDQGDIGLATSADTKKWDYKQIVLDESFHLSYPYVFKWKGEYYMVPESGAAKSIRLYKATDFPTKWEYMTTLLDGSSFVDSSIFEYRGQLWLFVTSNDNGNNNNNLRLFYADDLTGKWTEHPRSPVIQNNADIARPGGRVLVLGDKIIRYAQDDYPTYGSQVRAFMISELTASSYKEEPVGDDPVVKAGQAGWNKDGMHQVDAHEHEAGKWVACVDGRGRERVFGFKR
jgi:hypothetical protein